MPLFSEQERVHGIDVQAPALRPRTLCPLEEPEADPEGETICERGTAQFVRKGDLEALAVLDIGRVSDVAMQCGSHDGSVERDAGEGVEAPQIDS